MNTNYELTYLQDTYIMLSSIAAFNTIIKQLISRWSSIDGSKTGDTSDFKRCEMIMSVIKWLDKSEWSKAADAIRDTYKEEADQRKKYYSYGTMEMLYKPNVGDSGIYLSRSHVGKWLSLNLTFLILYTSSDKDIPRSRFVQEGALVGEEIPEFLYFFKYAGYSVQSSCIELPPSIIEYDLTFIFEYHRSIVITVKASSNTSLTYSWARSKLEDRTDFYFVFFKYQAGSYSVVSDEDAQIEMDKEHAGTDIRRVTVYLSEVYSKSSSKPSKFAISDKSRIDLITFYHVRDGKAAFVSMIKGDTKPRYVAEKFSEMLRDSYDMSSNSTTASMVAELDLKDSGLIGGCEYDIATLFSDRLVDKLTYYEECRDSTSKKHLKYDYSDKLKKCSDKPKLYPDIDRHDPPTLLIINIDNKCRVVAFKSFIKEILHNIGYKAVSEKISENWIRCSKKSVSDLDTSSCSIIFERHILKSIRSSIPK